MLCFLASATVAAFCYVRDPEQPTGLRGPLTWVPRRKEKEPQALYAWGSASHCLSLLVSTRAASGCRGGARWDNEISKELEALHFARSSIAPTARLSALP
jgi:hypothetical protein